MLRFTAFFSTIVALAIVIGLISVFLPRGFVDPEFGNPVDWQDVVKMERNQGSLVSSYDETLGYAFGRSRRPIMDMNLHKLTTSQRIAQRKEFVWSSVTDGSLLVGSALLQFGYTTGAIVYVYDSKSGESMRAHLELPLLASFGATFEPSEKFQESSVVNGCAKWSVLGLEASKCYNESSRNFDVSLVGRFTNGKSFDIQYDLSTLGETMSMVFPLGPNRASVVTKMGGATSHAKVSIDNKVVVMDKPLGLIDYTRGLLRRLTLWHWTAVSWRVGDNQYGFQLSEGTYDDKNGVSLESTLWVNNVAHHISSRVVYTQLDLSVDKVKSAWSIKTIDGSVALTFKPADAIVGSFRYGIVDGDLFHMWGVYSGSVQLPTGEVISMKNAPGVLEDHYALW